MSRPRATSNRCVISQPVRRKTDADATGTNQFDATWIFCGKLLHCPVSVVVRAPSSAESPENWRLSSLLTVKRRAGIAELRWLPARQPKRKPRPGGQPDGSSYMGAWGGWALAPNTASMGRDFRSHRYWSREPRRTFKSSAVF